MRDSIMRHEEYVRHDALGLAGLIRSKEISAREALDAAIRRIERRDGAINAVVLRMFDEARSTLAAGPPDGPFTGVPFLLKDLGQLYRGFVTSSGSRLHAHDVADHDSTLVGRYRRAGLVVCGKTNTPEFGLASTTEPVLHGPTRNPWNTAYSSGGSSGGAAAAVAAGYVPAAHASDGGGSIRIPASCCSLVGLKPTRARVPMGPDQLEGWGGLSTVHVVSRTVRDSAALLDVSAGEELGAPYFAPARARYLATLERAPRRLRIALCLSPFTGAPLDPEVGAIAERAAAVCEGLGHRVEIAGPEIDVEAFKGAHGIAAVCGMAANLDARARTLGRPITRDDVETLTWNNYQWGRQVPAIAYVQAIGVLRRLGYVVAQFFERYDVLLTPTMACLPPRIGALDTMSEAAEPYLSILYQMIGFTALFNDTGNPAISLPLGRSKSGLPVGVQFAGAFGAEALLLRLARQLEAADTFRPALAPL
jgi:Asp-tRNA(Asn)/Glu-tRNA(Gln) amidotransferase A subunit family amidase